MRGTRIFAALAVVVGLAFLAAGTAGASTKHCSNGALCVWTGKHYKGTKYRVTEPGNIVNFPSKVNNKGSSAKNRWVNKATLYEGKGATGQAFCMPSGDNVPDFSAFVDPSNNKYSSAFLDKSGGPCPARRAAKDGTSAKASSGCPADTLCVWARKNYRGQKVEITKINAISNKLAKRMDNEASSFKNRIAVPGALYAKKDGEGAVMGFCDNEKLPDLGDPKIDFDNRASSSIVGNESTWRARRLC
jgi:hypothetical protein